MWDCFIQEICCFISFSSLLRPLSVRRTAGQRHSSHMQLFVTPHRPRRCFLFHMYNVYCCNLIMNLSMWWWGGRKCLVSRIFFVFDGGAWKKQVKYSKVMFEVKGQGQPVGQQASLSSSQGFFFSCLPGILLAMTSIGPAFGFITGALMLRFYVDFDKVPKGEEAHCANAIQLFKESLSYSFLKGKEDFLHVSTQHGVNKNSVKLTNVGHFL